ncbi:cytochrome c oxidase subunit II [Oleidesulfovibrio alaskensis]|uniref:cytochrome c oxidase subunit II n=1 Tax=Oleidesulfovibrio alaskensis TaxID=58180 RepID=UPI001A61BB4A|nr:cytochrome c oxidase subunit II [Oleidesulfovibrio alaskensis]MBL3581635.1 cytochrome c oxidase subunit II [Oleidesulfovibrio alaskensis]MBL3588114.1 cytochrome c oxidase subunit II [bacterium]
MFPQSLSPVQQVDLAFYVIFGISIAILVCITACMLWFAWRYHHTRNPKPARFDGNVTAEVLWTVIPSLLVMGMFYYGWIGFKALRSVPANAMEVKVTARMWSWVFEYPNGKRANTLYVPVNKAIRLDMTSADVLHSFYVPAFRIKMDTVPGMDTYAWFKAERTGEYDILCAEYCGLKHANMLSTVAVMPEKDFEDWLNATEQTDDEAQALALLETHGCISCHSLDGSPGLGPTLKDIYGAERPIIMPDGTKTTMVADEQYLRRALLQPNAEVVEGYDPMMPSYQDSVPPGEIDLMVGWMLNRNQSAISAGRKLMQEEGCISCHSTDGSEIMGPSVKNLYGYQRLVIEDGTERTVTADESYLIESILNPSEKLTKGYDPVMPPYEMDEERLNALVEYMKSLSDKNGKAQ